MSPQNVFDPVYVAILIRREHQRLFKNLDGLRAIDAAPDVMFVIDLKREHNLDAVIAWIEHTVLFNRKAKQSGQ